MPMLRLFRWHWQFVDLFSKKRPMFLHPLCFLLLVVVIGMQSVFAADGHGNDGPPSSEKSECVLVLQDDEVENLGESWNILKYQFLIKKYLGIKNIKEWRTSRLSSLEKFMDQTIKGPGFTELSTEQEEMFELARENDEDPTVRRVAEALLDRYYLFKNKHAQTVKVLNEADLAERQFIRKLAKFHSLQRAFTVLMMSFETSVDLRIHYLLLFIISDGRNPSDEQVWALRTWYGFETSQEVKDRILFVLRLNNKLPFSVISGEKK